MVRESPPPTQLSDPLSLLLIQTQVFPDFPSVVIHYLLLENLKGKSLQVLERESAAQNYFVSG